MFNISEDMEKKKKNTLAESVADMFHLLDNGDLTIDVMKNGSIFVVLSYRLYEAFYLRDIALPMKSKILKAVTGVKDSEVNRARFGLLLRGIRTFANFLITASDQEGKMSDISQYDFAVLRDDIPVYHGRFVEDRWEIKKSGYGL